MSHHKYVRVATLETDEVNQDKSIGQAECIGKVDILQWFLQAADSDATWVLQRLEEAVPHLLGKLMEKSAIKSLEYERPYLCMPERMPTRPSHYVNNQRAKRKKLEEMMPDVPIVQFTSSVYYASEGVDGIMVLDVMRIGDQSGTSEVFYETEDDSALQGRSYEATSGKLVFEPGENLCHIEIPIIDNELWDTTTEFKCRLKEAGLQGAVLGRYLFQTRVKIIDNDSFPTDDFQNLTNAEAVQECPKWPLLRGYFSMASRIPRVWSGTIKYMLVDCVHNLYYLFRLFMTAYILDFIVDIDFPSQDLVFFHDRRQSLIFCASIAVINVVFSHVLDLSRISFSHAGPARSFVRSALLRKFLNYKRIVRERLPAGSVLMGIQRDSVDLANLGYENMLKIFGELGKILCMLVFQVTSPMVFGGSHGWHAFGFVMVIPLLLIVFLRCREHTTSQALHARNQMFAEFLSQVEATVANNHLVIDYSLRNHCEYKFLEKQSRYAAAARTARQKVKNNEYFSKYCQSLMIATWTLYGGMKVIDGSLKIGLFVTNLRLFEGLGRAFLEVYSLAVEMMNTFPALENVTTLMNLPTDVMHRYKLKRAQRAQAHSFRETCFQESRRTGIAAGVPIDIMPITMKFYAPFKFEGKSDMLNFKGQVEIHQGQVVAVVGPLGCGKATLLRLIAGSVLPSDGEASPVFVPSHLRVANVADEALFFEGTLFDNLTFGMDTTSSDASHQRVKAICKRLVKSHLIADYLDCEKQESWHDVCSGAQCKLLSVARALIHNVELLCIHKPLARLTYDDAEHVIQALHDHVDCRGLELPEDSSRRRPRTIILSAGTDRAVQEAHNVVTLDPVVGMKLLIQD